MVRQAAIGSHLSPTWRDLRQNHAHAYSRVGLITFLMATSLGISQGAFNRSSALTLGSPVSSLKIVKRLSWAPNVSGLVWSPDGSNLATSRVKQVRHPYARARRAA
jgi:hypothetical protein